MQNRYAGDIGDYIKIALLRALGVDRRVGVTWYLYPDEGHNSDGRHISYLFSPGRWRHLDPELFDFLADTVGSERSVRALQPILGDKVVFASEPILTAGLAAKDRCDARTAWFGRVLEVLSRCDLVFADPDNGFVADEPHRRRVMNFGKQIPLSEAFALSAGRTAVIYHHNSRFKGGHDAEVNNWLHAFRRPAIAVRATAYSCRTFFIINPDVEIADRARQFCERWKDHKVRLHEPA